HRGIGLLVHIFLLVGKIHLSKLSFPVLVVQLGYSPFALVLRRRFDRLLMHSHRPTVRRAHHSRADHAHTHVASHHWPLVAGHHRRWCVCGSTRLAYSVLLLKS